MIHYITTSLCPHYGCALYLDPSHITQALLVCFLLEDLKTYKHGQTTHIDTLISSRLSEPPWIYLAALVVRKYINTRAGLNVEINKAIEEDKTLISIVYMSHLGNLKRIRSLVFHKPCPEMC